MRADELRSAVIKVVDILAKADLLAAVRNLRAAKGEDRTVAAARLGHAGAVVMENMGQLSDAESAVVDTLHLSSLASTAYWQDLLHADANPQKQAAELVNLYSRAMFATSHLPNLANTLSMVGSEAGYMPVETGQKRMVIRLSDAAEKAADPDRVARAIDGIDMLYSACASLSRKPAMDLRLDGVSGTDHRDAAFTGGAEGVAAVLAVMESIPAAVSEAGGHENDDITSVVTSLPIFQDLKILAEIGTFSETELSEISETMHQGVVLTMESGVVVLPEQAFAASVPSAAPAAASVAAASTAVSSLASGATNGAVPPAQVSRAREEEPPTLTKRPESNGAVRNGLADDSGVRDEHYEKYLREREAMQKGVPPEVTGIDDKQRRAEVAALLKTLEQDRNGN